MEILPRDHVKSDLMTYSFREMYDHYAKGPRLQVVHNQSGATMPYNHGKVFDHSRPVWYKYECFAEWYAMSRKQRKQLWKEWREKMELSELSYIASEVYNQHDSFANLRGSVYNQKKENTMQTLNIVARAEQAASYPTDQRQKDHLLGRLHEIKYTKRNALEVEFGLSELPRPKTPAELVAYIKEGKYVFKHEDDLSECDSGFCGNEFYYSPWRYIEFRDPAVKADREGYEKAEKALEKLYDDTKDDIVVLDVEKGLAALRQFESTTVN